jgi:hypothetical protein
VVSLCFDSFYGLQVVNKWSRPEEVVREQGLHSRPRLFAGPANPSDVCQGRLGDCWFLSAVAVLTEASRISDVIVTPEFNEEGIYTVRFCIQVNTSIVLRFNVAYKNCLAT